MTFRSGSGSRVVVILLMTWFSAQGYSQEHSVRPGINRYYADPDYQAWVNRFERPGREIYDRRHEIQASTGIRPGMAVADVGAGTGLFTRLFAPLVTSRGRVYAVDISPVFIDNIMRTSQGSGLDNVEGIVNSPRDSALPPASIDLAFLCDTYHHLEYPHSMMRSLYRALRPGGSLIVIDYRKIEGRSSRWVMNHVRASKDEVIREISAAGFELREEKDFLRENYFLRFARTGEGDGS